MILFMLSTKPSSWAENRVQMVQQHETFNTGVYEFLGTQVSHLTAEDWDNLIRAGKRDKYAGYVWTQDQKNKYQNILRKCPKNITSVLKKDAEIMEAKRKRTADTFIEEYQKLTKDAQLDSDLEKLIRTRHLFKIINPHTLQEDDISTESLQTIEDLLREMHPRNEARIDLFLSDLEHNLARLIRRHWLLLKMKDTNKVSELQSNIQIKREILKQYKVNQSVLPPNLEEQLQDNPPFNPKTIIVFLHKMGESPAFYNNSIDERGNHRNYIEELGLRDSRDVLCVAPRAPYPFYFGIQHGWKWFELPSIGTATAEDKPKIQRRIREARLHLKLYLKKLQNNHPDAQIVLFGFSQGAISGLDLVTHTHQNHLTDFKDDVEIKNVLGGIFVAGAFDNRDQNGVTDGKTIHLFHNNAETKREGQDLLVTFTHAEEAKQKLENMDKKPKKLTLHTNYAPWHQLDERTIQHIKRLLQQDFVGTETNAD